MILGNGVGFYSPAYGSAPFIGLLTNCNQGLQSTQQPVQPSSFYNPTYQQQLPTHPLLKNEPDNGPSFKLYDFNSNNQSELIRLLFYYAGVSFKDKRVKQDEWNRVKDNVPIQQLPILRVNSHFKIYYFNSIVRYLAREFSLYGTENQEYALVDMIFETTSLFQDKLFEQIGNSSNDEERKTLLTQFITNHAGNHLNKLEKFFKIFHRNGPFYLGSQITLADLIVYQTINYLIDIDPKLLDNYSHLKEARIRLEKHPQIINYLNAKKYPKNKKKRHITLSPTLNNVYHYYPRYPSHDGRKLCRRRHQSKEPPLFVQTRRDSKASSSSSSSKEKEIKPPSQGKQESRSTSIQKEEKESTPPRPVDIIPQPPPIPETIPQPPPLIASVPSTLPLRIAEVIPQPPPVTTVKAEEKSESIVDG
ncbi:hypothetical protein I4U23_025133 [Adineta vaga]|nr:hypothetical protein I4U23_025133 [Adineta vaga]